MANKTSRALRRHHRARMYNRAYHFKKHIHQWFYDFQAGSIRESTYWTDENIHLHLSRARDNMTQCSCPMCRNPRHNPWASEKERLTLQEKKENERYKYEMKEINEE